MPSIYNASQPVKEFPNRFISPFGNDLVIPVYSSVPPKQGNVPESCLPCVVCQKRDRFVVETPIAGGGSGGGGGVIITTNQKPCTYSVGGFENEDTRYCNFVLYDWDKCLYSDGIIDYCRIPMYADGTYYNSPPWLVDGHVVFEQVGTNLSKVTEVTGGLIPQYPLNSTHDTDYIFSNIPIVLNNTHRIYPETPWCGNPTGEYIQIALF